MLSPESVGKQQKQRRGSGSGDLRPEAVRPEIAKRTHKRASSGDSTSSSVNLVSEDMPLPHPPMMNGNGNGNGGGDPIVPKLAPGDAIKMPVRAAVPPVRAAVPRPIH